MGPQIRNYSYDAAGERLSGLSNPAVAYSYDGVGNMTADDQATYIYSGRNRLVSVKHGAGTVATYEYNALGQRVAKTVAAKTLFAYDETGHVLGEYDDVGSLIQETVWLKNTPIATLRRSGAATAVHYVWADHLDTPRAITSSDLAATLEWSWDSDPFGTTAPNEGMLTYNLRFAGQYFDSETGRHYNYFRDYDPSIGRYVEADPLGLKAGPDLYGYVRGEPLKRLDPRGLASFVDEWGTYNIDQPTSCIEDPITCGQNVPDDSAKPVCFTRCALAKLIVGEFQAKAAEGAAHTLEHFTKIGLAGCHALIGPVFFVYHVKEVFECHHECYECSGGECPDQPVWNSPDNPDFPRLPPLSHRR